MKRFIAIALLLLAISPVHAGFIFGPLTSGSSQTPPPTGTAPVVTSLACTIALPVTNGVNVNLVGGGSCAYTATCNSTACTGMNAITGWAITTQSTANSFSITNAGILQGGSAAGSVTTGSYTVTVTATNSTGTSPGVVQSISTFQPPVVASLACSIKSPITNNTNVTLQAGGNCQYTATCGGGACSGANAISGWSVVADTCTSCYQVTSVGILQGSTNAAVVTNETDTVTVVATNAGGNSPNVAQTVTAVTVPVITNQNFSVNLPLTPGGGQTIGTMAAAPAASSWAITAVSTNTCPGNDGTSGATAGSAQFPSLLGGYTSANTIHSLGCNVAGVDYRVGLIASPTLKDPTSALLPTGCTYSSHVVTCVTAGQTISGYDFSVSNGVGLAISASNMTVTGNNFNMGSTNDPVIRINSGANNTKVTYNNITNNSQLDNVTFGGLIYVVSASATSGLTVEYNYMFSTGADFIDTGVGNVVVKYNLMLNDGEASGSHPDYIQHNPSSGNITDDVEFNTWVQNSTSIVSTSQGNTMGDNGTFISGAAVFSYNTMIANSPGNTCCSPNTGIVTNYWLRVVPAQLTGGATVVVQHNYGDISNAFGMFYGGSSGTNITFSNNFNMVSGAAFSNTP